MYCVVCNFLLQSKDWLKRQHTKDKEHNYPWIVVEEEREKLLAPWKKHCALTSKMTHYTASSKEMEERLKRVICNEIMGYWDSMQDHEIAKSIIKNNFSDFVDELDIDELDGVDAPRSNEAVVSKDKEEAEPAQMEELEDGHEDDKPLFTSVSDFASASRKAGKPSLVVEELLVGADESMDAGLRQALIMLKECTKSHERLANIGFQLLEKFASMEE